MWHLCGAQAFWARYDWQPGSPEASAGYPDAELPAALRDAPPSAHRPSDAERTRSPSGAHSSERGSHVVPPYVPPPELAPEWSANTMYRASRPVTCWGGDLFAASQPPVFLLELVVSGQGLGETASIQLVPSLDEVMSAVLSSYDDVIRATHNVDDISCKVVDVSSMQRLPSVGLDEPVAEAARGAIRGVVEKNLAAPAALLASYNRDFAALVATETAKCVPYIESGRASACGMLCVAWVWADWGQFWSVGVLIQGGS